MALMETIKKFNWHDEGPVSSVIINKKHHKETRCLVCPMSSVSAWSTAAAVPGEAMILLQILIS